MIPRENLDSLTEASSRAISNIKFGKAVVWDSGGGNGNGATAGFLQNMTRTFPPMMQVMRDIAGIELPESLFKLSDGEAKAESNGAAKPIVQTAGGTVANGPYVASNYRSNDADYGHSVDMTRTKYGNARTARRVPTVEGDGQGHIDCGVLNESGVLVAPQLGRAPLGRIPR